jgi:hypothetical protein
VPEEGSDKEILLVKSSDYCLELAGPTTSIGSSSPSSSSSSTSNSTLAPSLSSHGEGQRHRTELSDTKESAASFEGWDNWAGWQRVEHAGDFSAMRPGRPLRITVNLEHTIDATFVKRLPETEAPRISVRVSAKDAGVLRGVGAVEHSARSDDTARTFDLEANRFAIFVHGT